MEKESLPPGPKTLQWPSGAVFERFSPSFYAIDHSVYRHETHCSVCRLGIPTDSIRATGPIGKACLGQPIDATDGRLPKRECDADSLEDASLLEPFRRALSSKTGFDRIPVKPWCPVSSLDQKISPDPNSLHVANSQLAHQKHRTWPTS